MNAANIHHKETIGSSLVSNLVVTGKIAPRLRCPIHRIRARIELLLLEFVSLLKKAPGVGWTFYRER